MREIKFRARHKKDGKWFYGTSGILPANDETVMSLSIFWHLIEVGELDAETIGQYTGLKEIYEGDIVRRDDYMGEVKLGWFECDAFDCYGYEITSCFTDNYETHAGERFLEDAEVIGNIYETRHLLELLESK